MRKEINIMAAMGLVCILLFAACGGNTSKAIISDIGISPCLSTSPVKNVQMMKSSGHSGYEYGQALWVVQCKEYITLRSRASTSAESLDHIPLYAQVTYIGDASNGFLHIVYNGTAGYALAEYLDEFEPQIAIGQYMMVVKCKESITLRTRPSTKAGEICQIPLGAVVYAVKDAGNGFFMVEYNGQEGYALSSYLSANTTGVSQSNENNDYYYGQPLWVVNCKEYITLRSRASTSADALDYIPLYGQVTYLGTASNGFLHVVYNGTSGYALEKYLDEYEPQIAIGRYMTVVKCNESITLRKKPSTKAGEICQIPLGALVYVVKDAGNGFYMVEYYDKRGYALARYLD